MTSDWVERRMEDYRCLKIQDEIAGRFARVSNVADVEGGRNLDGPTGGCSYGYS